MIEIIFLGTGGGRFAMITQQRRTGGIRVLSGDSNLHLDPGPGALIYSLQEGLDPQKINAMKDASQILTFNVQPTAAMSTHGHEHGIVISSEVIQ